MFLVVVVVVIVVFIISELDSFGRNSFLELNQKSDQDILPKFKKA